MKKHIIIFFVVILWAFSAIAGPVKLPDILEVTVANIPSSPSTGQVIRVTDGDSDCDTTTGLGTYVYEMRYSGSAWVCIGDGGGVGVSATQVSDAYNPDLETLAELKAATKEYMALQTGADGAGRATIDITPPATWGKLIIPVDCQDTADGCDVDIIETNLFDGQEYTLFFEGDYTSYLTQSASHLFLGGTAGQEVACSSGRSISFVYDATNSQSVVTSNECDTTFIKTISVQNMVVDDPDNHTFAVGTDEYNAMFGGKIVANADGECTMAAIASGMNFTIQADDGVSAIYNPNAADTIRRNGVALTQGEALVTSAAFGSCSLEYRAANTIDAVCTDGMTEETP